MSHHSMDSSEGIAALGSAAAAWIAKAAVSARDKRNFAIRFSRSLKTEHKTAVEAKRSQTQRQVSQEGRMAEFFWTQPLSLTPRFSGVSQATGLNLTASAVFLGVPRRAHC